MAEQTLQTLGRYTIRAELGRGGFATVYRALDTTLEREVALKVLKPGWTDDPRAVERFMREARLVARLKHPNIVTIHDVGQVEGRLFIAMELVPGRSLQRVVAEDGPLPWEGALAILEQTASALDYAHRQGLVHRDVKPANIILDESEPGENLHAALTDFGLVRGPEQASLSSGSTGGVVGTPEYIAPEIWDAQPATAASDIYALACVAHFMLTGQALFAAATPMAVLKRHMEGPILPKQWPASVPDGITEVLRQALGRAPGQRPRTAGEMVARLQECAEWELKRKAQEAEEAAQKTREAEQLRQAREAAQLAEEEARRKMLADAEQKARQAAETPKREAGRQAMPRAAAPPVAPQTAPTKRVRVPPTARRRAPVWVWGVVGGVLALLAMLGGVWLVARPARPTPQAAAADSITPSPVWQTPTLVPPAPTLAPTQTPVPPTATSAPFSIEPRQGKRLVRCEGTRPPQICVQNIRTGQITQITKLAYPDMGGASWAPDGQQLVFSAVPSQGKPQKLFVMNADGSNLRQITSGSTYDHEAAWSPDGQWIAFHRDCGLGIVRPDGSGAQVILQSQPDKLCVEAPAWSPDSQQIAFLNIVGGSSVPSELWKIRRDGTILRQMYPFGQRLDGGKVSWSLDGQQLIVWSYESLKGGVMVSVDGSQSPLTIEHDPYWIFSDFWPQWASYKAVRGVYVDLGVVNDENGLAQIESEGDGRTEPVNVGGKSARRSSGSAPCRYIYFGVDDQFVFAQKTPLRVMVEYYDAEKGDSFDVGYDSADASAPLQGRFKDTTWVSMTASQQWKTVSFDLPDAYLGNRQHERADFRLAVCKGTIYIHRVIVTKP